ncbi:MAG: hypothetical protein JJU40_02015 [Rhodobacteraceae bacterium]|nr:hypothetical protein [Paracoccaceae bacterium]
MAIFFVDGFSFAGQVLDGEGASEFRNARLVLGTDTLAETMSYTILPEPWTDANIPRVDLNFATASAASLDGALLLEGGGPETDLTVGIARLTLGPADSPTEADLLIIFNPATGRNSVFQLGGPEIAMPTSAAEVNALMASILGVAEIPPGDPLAPGAAIPLSSLPNTSTSEGVFRISEEPFTLLEGTGFTDILIGSNGPNTILGGDGDDFINPRNSIGGMTTIQPGAGDDQIDFRSAQQGANMLDYSDRTEGILLTIDGLANTGTIDKGAAGSDTILGVTGILERGWQGTATLSIRGTDFDDTHVFNVAPGQWLAVLGTPGTNSYTITGGGAVRLDLREGTEGAVVDLTTGTIGNGGFGNTGTITGALFEVAGTNFDDVITGGDANISINPWGGNNLMTGGGGINRIRFDQGEVRGLVVDLGQGGAIGTLNGTAFAHAFSEFQDVRSSQFGGVIIGGAAEERLQGRGGDDVLIAGTGDDLLVGGPGRTIFVLTPGGETTIRGFNSSTDVLLLAPLRLTEAEVAAAEAGIIEVDGGTFINFGDKGTLLLEGILPAQLDGIVAYDGLTDAGGRNPIIGTMGSDELFGTEGNDYINPRDNDSFDFIAPGRGNNVIDFSEAENGYFVLGYGGLGYDGGTGITALIGAEGTGFVIRRHGDGDDQLINVGQAMSADGLDIRGTGADDRFVIQTEAGQFVNILGGAGVDTYALSGEGIFRIDFQPGNQAAHVNLASGVIANDGFGNAEALPPNLVRHVRGTNSHDDVLIGNALDNVFIPLGGNVTLNGGGGTNLVRYDQGNVAGLTVNLASGVATGTAGWDMPVAFTHTLTGIQNVRGSQNGDTLIAGAGNHVLDGRGGDDVLISGAGGTDTLIGGAGADRFVITPLGQVIIADFNTTEDILDLTEMGLSEAQIDTILASATEHEGNLLIDFGGPELGNLTLQGLGLADLGDMEILGAGGGTPVEPGITRVGAFFENVPDGIYDYGIDAPGGVQVAGGAEFLMTTGSRGPTSIVGFRTGGQGEMRVEGTGSLIAMIEGSDPSDVMGLMIGREGGEGLLVVEEGARFEMRGDATAGQFAYVRVGGHDSRGELLVSDGGVFLMDRPSGDSELQVGFDNGEGALNLQDGGRFQIEGVDFVTADIGRTGGQGRAEITGAAELRLEAAGAERDAWLLVGTEGGTGEVLLDDGAVLAVYAGRNAGVRLAQRWTDTEETSGTARMDIEDGSQLIIGGGNVSELTVGGRAGGNADLYLNSGGTIIFQEGIGRMIAGGILGPATPGDESGMGRVDMRGAESSIQGLQQLLVGFNTGQGQMTVAEGAEIFVDQEDPDAAVFVSVGTGFPGTGAGGRGELTLQGTGGTSDQETYLFIAGDNPTLNIGGNGGEGRVVLTAGAVLEIEAGSTDVRVQVGFDGGTGVLDLGGAETRVTLTGDSTGVYIGHDGGDSEGLVILRAGATLEAGDRIVSGDSDPEGGPTDAGLVMLGGTAEADDMLFHQGTVLLGSGQLVDTGGGAFIVMNNAFLRVGDDIDEDYLATVGIGTLEVQGDFSKTGGEAIFQVGAGESDLLDVDGAVTLSGTTLRVDWQAPEPDPAGSAHMLMRATGGITGLDTLSLEADNLDPLENARLELREDGTELWLLTSRSFDLAGTVTDRMGTAFEGVDVAFTPTEGPADSMPTGADGAFLFELTPGAEGTLDASLAFDSAAHPTITTASALNVLRLALGRALPGRDVTGEDLVAADFDGNGEVTSEDAMEILRVALGRPTISGEAPRWVFLDADADLSGLTRNDASYETGISIAEMTSDVTGLGLTGILVGYVPDALST